MDRPVENSLPSPSSSPCPAQASTCAPGRLFAPPVTPTGARKTTCSAIPYPANGN
ncbi:MAG: hypothetical protein LBF62_12425 [Tannerellaceae bacterium]|nr:hypothetical protein [Tannerellaceae bacterium]